MVRKILCIFLISTILFAGLSQCLYSAQALNIKKIVSVVFDDSGSMNADGSKNWAYANYAMQAFCGLLNKEDQLYVTYMTQPDVSQMFDLTGDIQKPVDKIRNYIGSSSTPIQAMDTAFTKLQSITDTNPNTQYWLVIITDGIFADSYNYTVPKSELDSRMNNYTSLTMPNDSKAQITYLAIGNGAMKPDQNEAKGIYVYPNKTQTGDDSIVDGNQIVSVMSEIADKVSGRTRVDESKITFPNDNTVQISSDLPLLNIAVLSQKTSAKIIEATSADANLQMVQSANLLFPEAVNGLITDTTLKGATFLFNNNGGNIPAGNYTFKFSEPVNKDSIVIMYEPAIEIRMKLYFQSGKVITDFNALHAGDVVDILCNIYELGTDKVISADLLNADVEYDVSYYEDDVLIHKADGGELIIQDVTLTDVYSVIQSTIEIQGFLPMTNTVSFHPQKPVTYTMQATEPDDNVIGRLSMSDNEKGVVFTVFSDGIPLTKTELENIDVSFDIKNPFGKKLSLDTVLNNDGTYTCIPKYDFWNWTASWILPVGELTISGSFGNNELAHGVLWIARENIIYNILNIFIPLLCCFFLLGWIFKRRFPRKVKVKSITVTFTGYMMTSQGSNWTVKKLRASVLSSLIPYIPSRRKIGAVTFYARPGGYIGVKIKKIGKDSRKINGNLIREDKVVEYTASGMRKTFVPKDTEYSNKIKFEDFTTGDILFDTNNTQTGKLYKFIGGN